MHLPVETIPPEELEQRYARCRKLLAQLKPEAGGILTFSRNSIYYFTGTMGFGVFWLPLEGEPLLMVRKGLERARLESPGLAIVPFRSFSDLENLAVKHDVPFPGAVAAEQSSLPWALADNLKSKLTKTVISEADTVLSRLRAVKTPWELAKMRLAGAGHARAVEIELPRKIRPGMSEMEIARLTIDVFFDSGSCGLTRMHNYGEEILLGHISGGDNGNFPTFYNGALGCKGLHPTAPFFGSANSLWNPGDLLTHDAGFCCQGYNSDKTQTFFAGRADAIPAKVQKAYDVCRDIASCIAAQMKPGTVPSALYGQAMDKAAKEGFADGFMGIGDNKVPFLGHGIGLCIDEWPVLAKRFDTPLQAGMTIAVEPKIGLPGIGMVGIENTWEISEDGAVCLSSNGCTEIICID
ncbi:MAG: Xaa-Pro peptidase family protein [Desulfovibrio sp.]|jgi:Xaa-Pro dipeptidase|nr:Xaa-Pro peptidase family protein [Desulfovibrio sp.]